MKVVLNVTVLHLVLLRLHTLCCRVHLNKTERSILLMRHPVCCAADQFTSILPFASSPYLSIILGDYV